MAAGVGIEIIDVSGVIPKLAIMPESVKNELHLQAPDLGVTLTHLVVDKTPELTGALKSDMTYQANPKGGGDDLVWVFAEGLQQAITWGRLYVQYQEGPPLGVSTYTNPPRLMFLDTATGDGYTATSTWAFMAVEAGIARAGLPAMGGGKFGFA